MSLENQSIAKLYQLSGPGEKITNDDILAYKNKLYFLIEFHFKNNQNGEFYFYLGRLFNLCLINELYHEVTERYEFYFEFSENSETATAEIYEYVIQSYFNVGKIQAFDLMVLQYLKYCKNNFLAPRALLFFEKHSFPIKKDSLFNILIIELCLQIENWDTIDSRIESLVQNEKKKKVVGPQGYTKNITEILLTRNCPFGGIGQKTMFSLINGLFPIKQNDFDFGKIKIEKSIKMPILDLIKYSIVLNENELHWLIILFAYFLKEKNVVNAKFVYLYIKTNFDSVVVEQHPGFLVIKNEYLQQTGDEEREMEFLDSTMIIEKLSILENNETSLKQVEKENIFKKIKSYLDQNLIEEALFFILDKEREFPNDVFLTKKKNEIFSMSKDIFKIKDKTFKNEIKQLNEISLNILIDDQQLYDEWELAFESALKNGCDYSQSFKDLFLVFFSLDFFKVCSVIIEKMEEKAGEDDKQMIELFYLKVMLYLSMGEYHLARRTVDMLTLRFNLLEDEFYVFTELKRIATTKCKESLEKN